MCPACGSQRLRKIDDDRREVLEYVPSHFKVVVHVRPKLSCRDCEAITQPPMPALPIERGRPGAGLVAHVIISKYCDHTPLNRQSDIYARQGVDLDRSTMAGWVGKMAWLLTPLSQAIADYAPARAQDVHAERQDRRSRFSWNPGSGETKKGQLWVCLRDGKPWQISQFAGCLYHHVIHRPAKAARPLPCSSRVAAIGMADG